MLNEQASGVYVISVTPFLDDGRIDHASIDRMVEFYRGCGVSGITILGMMGEASKLDADEAIDVAKRVVTRSGKLPVIVACQCAGLRGDADAGARGDGCGRRRRDDRAAGHGAHR